MSFSHHRVEWSCQKFVNYYQQQDGRKDGKIEEERDNVFDWKSLTEHKRELNVRI